MLKCKHDTKWNSPKTFFFLVQITQWMSPNGLHDNNKAQYSRDLIIVRTSLCDALVNPHYGRPGADLNLRLRTQPITVRCVTAWDGATPTLWCSHKVNVKLHSAAALQQWAFKLIWLAVKPHAGARTRGHRNTHRNTHTHTHGHTHARGINTQHGQSERYRHMHGGRKSRKAPGWFTLSVSSWGLSSPYILWFLRIY